MSERTIIDVGMHNGADTDFYLKKGFRVIAIEANPRFAAAAREKFAAEIAEGRLEIVEGAITDAEGDVSFYVNLDQDLWSAVDEKIGSRMGTRAEKITVPSIRIEDILEGRDDVYYIKCDIEHADIFVLRALGRMRRLPRYFSVEAHGLAYLSHLVVQGYEQFKVVNQGLHRMVKLPAPPLEGRYVEHRFDGQSSGPFGEETAGAWQTFEEVAETFLATKRLKQSGPQLIPGYFDFHARFAPARDPWRSDVQPGTSQGGVGAGRPILVRPATQRPEAAADERQGEHKLFFVRGHMRSGTNWCANILNLHPKVFVHGEFHLEIVRDAVRRFTTEPWSMGARGALKNRAQNWFEQFVRECLLTLADRKPGAEWLGDRTPAPVDPLLPGARHILMVRDGRDVLVSWTFHQLRIGGPSAEPHRTAMAELREAFVADPHYFSDRPHRLLENEQWVRSQARMWRNYIREHIETQARIDRGELDASILWVKYEELYGETERIQREMYRYLGLDFDEAEPLSQDSNTTAGFEREDPRSFFRKGAIGDWKRYATDDFRRWFKEEAGDELIASGYEADQGW